MKEKFENIAWQGWSIPIKPDWRPIDIEGDFKRGKMMIGTAAVPLMQVKWWRPSERRFHADEWISARIREMKTFPSDNPPVPQGFAAVGWIKNLEFKEDVSKTIWYGYEESADLLIEIVTTSIADAEIRRKIESKIIPALKVYGKNEDVLWNLYKVSFMVPPEYILRRKHLYSGDIGLEFINSKKDILILRQVYPAELALTRRTLKEWLKFPVFKTRRKFKLKSDDEWSVPELHLDEGLKRSGIRCIAFPFRWLAPRQYKAVIARDTELDRLLMAELISADSADFAPLEKLIEKMNITEKKK